MNLYNDETELRLKVVELSEEEVSRLEEGEEIQIKNPE
jgi:hypothetical protein